MADLARRLKAAYAQLNRYAEDLNLALRQSIANEKDVRLLRQQLQLYAHDFKRALDAERARADELDTAYYDTVLRLMMASQYRDHETGEHIRRIIDYVRLLGTGLGLEEPETEVMAQAAALHDVGKIAIDDAILRKPAPLSPAEWELMREHPVIGARILAGSPSPLLQRGYEIALTHHENWDGSGYPQGLVGEAIPLAGRLVMLADRYDALRSERPYKETYDHRKTVKILLTGSDEDRTRPEHFEPRLLELFARIHPEFDAIWRIWQTDVAT